MVSGTERIRYRDTSQDWKTLKGDLITVHWYAGRRGVRAQGARHRRAGGHATPPALLGVTETEPIDFFIYADETAFRDGARARAPARTSAARRTRTSGRCSRSSSPTAIDDPWVGIVVPHELTHLVFDTAVENPYHVPAPLAQRGPGRLPVGGLRLGRPEPRSRTPSRRGDLIPLVGARRAVPDGPRQDVPRLRGGRVRDRLPRARRTGRDALVALVLAYKDGLTDDEAFTKALGRRPRDVPGGLARRTSAPSRRSSSGPQPAPPGPLPSGWSGAAPDGVPDPIAPTSRPGATARAPEMRARQPAAADAGASTPLLVGGLALVVGVVLVGLVIAATRGRGGRMTALGDADPAIPSWQVTLGVALLALGFLIAAQLASEGPRIRYTSLERTPLVETALDLQAQQESLKAAGPRPAHGHPGPRGRRARAARRSRATSTTDSRRRASPPASSR